MIPNTGKVAKYFYDHFNEIHPSTNGWMEFTCPLCGKHKGAVNFYKQKVKCWKGCFDGYVIDFISIIESIPRNDVSRFVMSLPGEVFVAAENHKTLTPKLDEALAIPYPEAFVPIGQATALLGQRAVNYLTHRGFDIDYLDYLGFGYCTEGDYHGRIIIPFFVNGKLRFFQGRSFLGAEPKYLNPTFADIGVGKEDLVYNEIALSLHDEVFVLEGALDAIYFSEQATSTQGWSMSRWQVMKYLKSRATKITFIPDVGFYDNALQIASNFVERKEVRVLNLDPIAYLGKDVNEIGVEPILELRRKAKPMNGFDLFNLMIDRL